MSGTALAAILRDLRKLCGLQAAEQTTDDALLARFTQTRDEAAFTALLQRHAPMLWAICRRLLPEEHATADAFQATALVFARKASSIRKGSSVAGWLARVGYRIALAARKQPRSAEALPSEFVDDSAPDPSQGAEQREVRRALDEEIHRLPEKYRLPVVLCFFENRSHAEAAVELQWPVGTVAGRLARAKELLHARLTRRGCTLSASALSALLLGEMANAAPVAVTTAAVQAALGFAAGKAAKGASSTALALAQSYLLAEVRRRLWTGAAVLLLTTVGVLATWAALTAHEEPPPQPAPQPAPVAAQPVALRIPRNRMAHNPAVSCLALSPDGKIVASGSFDFGQFADIKLWDLATSTELFTLKGHAGSIMALAFSPDGATLASASAVARQPGQIKLWDVRTGKERAVFPGHKDGAASLVFAPDGKTLLSAGWDKLVILWDVATGFERTSIATGHEDKIHQLALSEDGKTLATASADRTIKLWDVTTLMHTATLRGHTDEVRCVAFSPDGKLLAAGCGSPNGPAGKRDIKLWDVPGAVERGNLSGHGDWIRALAFSKDGATLLSCSRDKTLRLWDVAAGKEQATLRGHSSIVHAVAYSRDGKTILSGSSDTTIKLWDIATRREHGSLTSDTDDIIRLSYAADGKTLASANRNKTIKLIDVPTGKVLATLTGHSTEIIGLEFSPDGRTVASASVGGTIKLWDVALRKESASFRGDEKYVSHLCFSGDGKLLAATSGYRLVRIWETATGKLLATVPEDADLRERLNLEHQLAFSPDSKTLAIWSGTDRHSGRLKLCAATTGQVLAAHQDVILPFGADGRALQIWSRGELRLWNAAKLKEKAQLKWAPYTSAYFLVSADGSKLAVRDGATIKLLDDATGRERWRIQLPADNTARMAFSPDSKTLAVLSQTQSLTLWDVATGKEWARLRGLNDTDCHILFSPDSRTLLTWHYPALLLWDVSRE